MCVCAYAQNETADVILSFFLAVELFDDRFPVSIVGQKNVTGLNKIVAPFFGNDLAPNLATTENYRFRTRRSELRSYPSYFSVFR